MTRPPDPSRPPPDAADADVPRLPRGRGMKLSGPQIVRILMTSAMLVAVLVMRRPCADSVARFVGAFDAPDAGVPPPRPGAVEVGSGEYEYLGNLSDDQVRAAVERARARARSHADAGDAGDAGVAPTDAGAGGGGGGGAGAPAPVPSAASAR